MDPTPPPTEPTPPPGGSPLRHALGVLFWLLFAASQYRGCEANERLGRMEGELREIRGRLEQPRGGPAPPAPR